MISQLRIASLAGASLLLSSCWIDSNIELGRPFNRGYGYLVYGHGEAAPSGATGSDKSLFPANLQIEDSGRYILTAFDGNASGGTEALMLRILPNGTADPTFGTDGAYEPNANQPSLLGGATASAKEELVAPHISWDDQYRYYFAFDSEGGNLVFRVNENGTTDTTFGSSGYLTLMASGGPSFLGGTTETAGFHYSPSLNSLIQIGRSSDAGGESFPSTARWSLTGVLDSTYGASSGYTVFNGGATTPAGAASTAGNFKASRSISPGPNGSFYGLICRDQEASGDITFNVVKIGSNGLYDTSFGPYGNGTAEIPGFGTDGMAGAAAGSKNDKSCWMDNSIGHVETDSNNRLYVVGTSLAADLTERVPVIVRWTSSGMLDTSFGNGGVVLFNAGGASVAGYGTLANKSEGLTEIAFDSVASRLILVGSSGDGATTAPIAVRLKMDGSLDSAFGSNGVIILSPEDRPGESFAGHSASPMDFPTVVRADRFGRYVISGYSLSDLGGVEIFIVRLNSDGTLNK